MPRRLPGMYTRNGIWYVRWPEAIKGSLGARDYTVAAAEYRRRRSEWEVSRATKTEEVRGEPTISGELDRYTRDTLPIRRCAKAARDAALRLRRACQPIADRRPGDLHPRDIEGCRRHLDAVRAKGGKPLSPQSIHDHLRDLKGFLRWLSRDYPIRCLPFERGIMPFLGDPESRAPAAGDLARFLAAAGEPVLSTAVFLLFTGLRPGELVKLEWPQVILTSGRPRLFFKASKTRRARTVWLPDPALQVLYRWRSIPRQPKEAQFVAPWRPRNMVGPFLVVSRSVGAHITPGMMRHAFANLYCDRGGTLEALQKLMGHASIRTTQRYRQAGQAFVEADWRTFFGSLDLNHVTQHVTAADPESPESAEVNS